MNRINRYSVRILMSGCLAGCCLFVQSDGLAAQRTTINLAQQNGNLGAEDSGVLPMEQARQFASSVSAQAANAALMVTSCSRVVSSTNLPFVELQQSLAVEATEPQLVAFFENVAATNSLLRVQSLALRPNPDRTRLLVNLKVRGDYRVPADGPSEKSAATQVEGSVLSQRTQLRRAALDCLNLTTSTLPAGWTLESLSFDGGKGLSIQGVAPADQLQLLQDLRLKFENARAQDGKPLFLPSSGDATMHMLTPAMTNFTWSMHFDLSSL